VQDANGLPSMLHSKVEAGSGAVKSNVAVVELSGSGGDETIAVSGGVVSTVHVRVSGVGSALPAASVARTANVCEPSASPVEAFGEVQDVNAAPSMLQAKLAPGSELVNENDAFADGERAGGWSVMVVSGAAVSTVNDRVAGDASGVPRLSVARTENVYEPSASDAYARGDVQAAYEPVLGPGPSSLHSNVEPGLVELNPNDGDAPLVTPVGPDVIAVSGAEVSTANARVAGDASTLPAPSVARTENV
jgi:hypothetical protein